MRIKCIISYNGSNYFGFQTQNKEEMNSIQDEIEKVLSKIFDTHIDIHASGRTDRGVHALGQVIHFDVEQENVDLYRLRYSINCMLPKDIFIKEMEIVNEELVITEIGDLYLNKVMEEKSLLLLRYLSANNKAFDAIMANSLRNNESVKRVSL